MEGEKEKEALAKSTSRNRFILAYSDAFDASVIVPRDKRPRGASEAPGTGSGALRNPGCLHRTRRYTIATVSVEEGPRNHRWKPRRNGNFAGDPTRKRGRCRWYRGTSGRGCATVTSIDVSAQKQHRGKERKRNTEGEREPDRTVSHWLLTRQNQLLSSVGRTSI
ncbi:hypothetical protein WN48_08553 [Eufriesea mexicana]|uniref:Uncharacterized protein n=1 Tax=Eufriesea mexicana TaxID=516756 RepID=A0A310SEY1_9HYME|nr:hypothetical protein WN48_08553 [Eufriesea mexicana]